MVYESGEKADILLKNPLSSVVIILLSHVW